MFKYYKKLYISLLKASFVGGAETSSYEETLAFVDSSDKNDNLPSLLEPTENAKQGLDDLKEELPSVVQMVLDRIEMLLKSGESSASFLSNEQFVEDVKKISNSLGLSNMDINGEISDKFMQFLTNQGLLREVGKVDWQKLVRVLENKINKG